jgi:uncharacterized protein (DUF362 family)
MMSISRVIVVRASGVFSPDGRVNTPKVLSMFQRGLSLLQEQYTLQENLRVLISSQDIVGIKINTIGGKRLSTHPDVVAALVRLLIQNGYPENNIVVWDRTNRELREAGFAPLRMSRNGVRIYGTDSQGVGYADELVSQGSVGSLFSNIQTRIVSASISLAVLKDHGLAGVTAGMKNYFGAIHNPNKYHDNHCDPFIAEVFAADPVKKKHRLTILDALKVQFHRGPAYHSQWAAPAQTLIFSTDPVAADTIGWQLIESLRKDAALPSLDEEKRTPHYIHTAARMGLGQDRREYISLIEEEL